MLKLYKKFNADKDYTSIGLFRELLKKYGNWKVIYPGSYVHITPSLIFPNVVYVDSHKNTFKFYESQEVIDFVDKKKEYPEAAKFKFYQQSYYSDLTEDKESFDYIISQYAWFVGQAAKKYLKKWGLLVCNNSHADASMASLDKDYKLVAVYNRKTDDKFSISEKSLETYLIPKKDIVVTKEHLTEIMRGIGYTKTPSGYIFVKL